ncbi:MAG TPA: BatD family protein, partial [Clostridia bacterium]|nr:BatD family protein [Clostridia bacterium]
PLMSLMLSQPRIDVESPVAPTATFDPPVVRSGQPAVYRITLNALETSVIWPDELPFPAKLDVRRGGQGQILAMANLALQPRTTYNYRVRASSTGQYLVPEFTVTVYGKQVTIPAARLEVVPAPPPGIPPMQQLMLDFPTTNLFVGQSVRARILAAASQGLGQVQMVGDGVVADPTSARQRIEMMASRVTGLGEQTLIYDISVTPIAAGNLSLFAQGYAITRGYFAGVIMPGGTAAPGSAPQYTLLDSEPVQLRVRPLPPDGRLPGFTGAVGSFSVDPPELSTNMLRVGEPVKLKVRVRGEGNVARLVAPPPPTRLSDWQVLPDSSDNIPVQIAQAQGFTTFNYTLVPLTEKVRDTPAIPFSAFDPHLSAYADLTFPSVPVLVRPGATNSDVQPILQANAQVFEPEKEPVLSGLATTPGWTATTLVPVQRRFWFPLIQLAPAAVFLGLWGWDRRRRFNEQHPNVVLRRRARRALHRERRNLSKAFHAGDGSRFAASAVNAMRIACSPHYPAEARALVGCDVLAVLPEKERSGPAGEVIRRFFAVTDAARYSTATAATAELLALEPELKRVLDQLEERL